MPVAIQIPNVRASGAPGASELAEMLKRAEHAGFHSAWVMEHQLGAASALESLSVLAFAAGQTSSMGLGLAVAILAVHQPVRLAREVATIDHLSGGRLTLGVGIGASGLPYDAFGITARDRASRFEEYLDVMRRLWEEPQVDYNGRFVRLNAAAMEPKPVHRPPPVWFGGSSPAALRRTARLADGWMGAGSSPSSAFPEMVSQLREQLAVQGRDPSSFPIGKRVYVAIERPAQEVREWFRAVYGPAISPEVAVTGSAAEVVRELRRIREAGAELLVVSPVGDDRPQLDLVIEHVLPALD
ncbi:MAG: LLM class flavin-dependent oxidoreductase [Solirubrobacterales bacterium]|nr:LLM class flavin-dependent oxidoreductase [Solirubrobacterales bacterium]MBV9534978.1 LLM class flavin-dependent oxidoreductase [Solirubrobacterales bacterium]